MKALKLVYFAERYHLRKYGRPITNDEYFAMNYGPVASGVKDIAEMSSFLGEQERSYAEKFIKIVDHDRYSIESVQELCADVFSDSDLEALEFAMKEFGWMDEFALADKTHKYPDWNRHENNLKTQSRIRMDYKDFFLDPEEGANPCYALTSKERDNSINTFEEIEKIASLWR